MGVYIGRGKKARRAYGFDEIAIVPGQATIDPADVDTRLTIGETSFSIPIMASAMDCSVNPAFAIKLGKLGGVGVLNLEGICSRLDDPDAALEEIAAASPEDATRVIQKIYEAPIKDKLVARSVQRIKDGGVPVFASTTPASAQRLFPIAREAGLTALVIQSTVSTVRHVSARSAALDIPSFCAKSKVPVIVGNCVTYEVGLELMEAGASAVLVGVGPGAACTTRGVLGLGVPQVTATADVSNARDHYFKVTGRYVPVITDGGMSTGAHVCKAFASGADGVMIGSSFSRTLEAPGRGYHWGMATGHASLPRGTRIHVGRGVSLEEMLFGPATRDDGTVNLVGALRTCMGAVGARTIKMLQEADLVIAPAITTEGKSFQAQQQVGMGR